MTRQRTKYARIVTPELTYQKFGLLLDESTVTIEDRARATVRVLTGVDVSVVDGGGRLRYAGLNEDGEPEVWTSDQMGCGCGKSVQIVPTVEEEVPV